MLAVGLGKPAEVNAKIFEEAGGAIVTTSVAANRPPLSPTARSTPQQAADVASGAVLRSLPVRPLSHQGKARGQAEARETDRADRGTAKAKAAWERAEATANGVFLTRDLVSEPPNVLDPAEMAERCRKLTELGVKVEILGLKEMTKLGFGALLGVSQGSANEPRMVVMHWNGARGQRRAKRRTSRSCSSARA